jgi:hypothetical protein
VQRNKIPGIKIQDSTVKVGVCVVTAGSRPERRMVQGLRRSI